MWNWKAISVQVTCLSNLFETSAKECTTLNKLWPFSGAQVEAATRLGPRLLRLSQEPVVAEITAALHKLEPGQDQVLANAIVRRLADAFQSGGNFTRLCILKVLLLEYKGRKESRAKKCSLFTKDRIPNYVEFLRRVKSVLDSGDSTARSLALRVLGCLAELASDSVEVFRLVLDALQSPHRLEVCFHISLLLYDARNVRKGLFLLHLHCRTLHAHTNYVLML